MKRNEKKVVQEPGGTLVHIYPFRIEQFFNVSSCFFFFLISLNEKHQNNALRTQQ